MSELIEMNITKHLLSQIIRALGSTRGFTRLLGSRQKHSNENSENGNHVALFEQPNCIT